MKKKSQSYSEWCEQHDSLSESDAHTQINLEPDIDKAITELRTEIEKVIEPSDNHNDDAIKDQGLPKRRSVRPVQAFLPNLPGKKTKK